MSFRPHPSADRARHQLDRHHASAPEQMTLAQAGRAAVTADPELRRLALESAALIARAVAQTLQADDHDPVSP